VTHPRASAIGAHRSVNDQQAARNGDDAVRSHYEEGKRPTRSVEMPTMSADSVAHTPPYRQSAAARSKMNSSAPSHVGRTLGFLHRELAFALPQKVWCCLALWRRFGGPKRRPAPTLRDTCRGRVHRAQCVGSPPVSVARDERVARDESSKTTSRTGIRVIEGCGKRRARSLRPSLGGGRRVLSPPPGCDRDLASSTPVHIGAQVFQAGVGHERDHLGVWAQPLGHL
jgi:hypothetical protein